MQIDMRSPYAIGALSEAKGCCSSGDRLDFRGEEFHADCPCCGI